jgi:hypothetical protein
MATWRIRIRRRERIVSTEIERFLGRPTAKIMLLGTFHFEDRGVDRYKPQAGFDVFSKRRQAEIAEVVERLAGFHPTKIALERRPQDQDEIDQTYSAYLESRFELPGDEVYQLGFRLAKHLRHNRVYCANAWGRYYEPPIDIEAHVREQGLDRDYLDNLLSPHTPQAYAQKHGQEHLLSQWELRFEELYGYWDQLKMQVSLREILLRTNEEELIVRGHGHYLVDWFKVGVNGVYPGVDWITAWYNRNLRIFANVQRITQSPQERILLIIGGGHLAILRHCVLASPEYELAEVHGYLALGER